MFDLTFLSCSYRVTLNQNEKRDDPEEQARALKACHQRCANRTLKVLEKNGSVFIKLGQHLVWWHAVFAINV
jgi:aarF domain-containing kinase